MRSKIKRALRLLDCRAFYGVGIDHGGPDITVPEQLLDGADIEIVLQQVTGKTVAEGMGGGPFADSSLVNRPLYRPLYMSFVQMIAPHLSRPLLFRESLGRKKPLPDELSGRILVFLLQSIHQKDPCIISGQIQPVEFFQT